MGGANVQRGGAPHVGEACVAHPQRHPRRALARQRRAVEAPVAQQQAQQARGRRPLEVEIEAGEVRREGEVVRARVERDRRFGRVPVDVLERLHTSAATSSPAIT